MLTEIFKALFITSLMGMVLTAVLMLLRPVTKKYFSAGWHYYMWLVVLLIMVLPVKFSLPENAYFLQSEETVEKPQAEASQEESVHHIIWQQSEAKDTERRVGSYTIVSFAKSKLHIISFAWLVIVIVLFFSKLSVYMVLRRKIMKSSEEFVCPLLKDFTKRKVLVIKSPLTKSPLMLGILRPVLVLPDVELNTEQLGNILAHEMTHFKRNDIAYKWFIALVKCIHWFNPMVYIIAKQAALWCEISCDLAVVGQMNREEERSYINTILALISASVRSENIPLATGMLGSKETLKRRFLMIKYKRSISKNVRVLSGIVTAFLMVGTLSVSGVMAGDVLEGEAGYHLTVEETESKQPITNLPEEEELTVIDVKESQQTQAEEEVEQPETKVVEFVWPCPSSSRITAAYNTRVHPVTGEKLEHNGIDIYAEVGENVVAAISGEVIETGFDNEKGYCVVIAGDDVEILYAHLSEILVEEGDTVTAGQSVAKTGNTGMATGPHLHFEIMVNGEHVDPQKVYQ